MNNQPMESHGLRLPPQLWRQIEFRAKSGKQDRSAWLREQIDWLFSVLPEVQYEHEEVTQMHEEPIDDDPFDWKEQPK